MLCKSVEKNTKQRTYMHNIHDTYRILSMLQKFSFNWAVSLNSLKMKWHCTQYSVHNGHKQTARTTERDDVKKLKINNTNHSYVKYIYCILVGLQVWIAIIRHTIKYFTLVSNQRWAYVKQKIVSRTPSRGKL